MRPAESRSFIYYDGENRERKIRQTIKTVHNSGIKTVHCKRIVTGSNLFTIYFK